MSNMHKNLFQTKIKSCHFIGFCLFFFLLINTIAHGYTIVDAINSTKLKNTKLKTIEQSKNLVISRSRGQAFTEFLPRVTYQTESAYTVFKDPVENTINTRTNSFNVNQSLFSFGRSVLNLQSGAREAKKADYEYRDSLNKILLSAIEAYNEVIATRKLYQNALQREETSSQILKQAEIKINNSFITKSELFEAKAEHANALAIIKDTLKAMKKAESEYLHIVGELPPQSSEMVEINPNSIPTLDTIENTIQSVIKNNLKLKSTAEGWRAAKAKKGVALLGFMPEVSFDFSARAYPKQDGIPEIQKQRKSHTSAIKIIVPIFNSGQEYVNVTSSSRQARVAEFEYQDQVSEITAGIVELWNSYYAAKAALNAQTATVQYFQESYDGAQSQFKYGTKSTTDLLKIQRELFDAKNREIRKAKETMDILFRIKTLSNEISNIQFDKLSEWPDSIESDSTAQINEESADSTESEKSSKENEENEEKKKNEENKENEDSDEANNETTEKEIKEQRATSNTV